jgi:hypothetical protein
MTHDNDSYPSDLFVYRGVVCQLVYRYPWYSGPNAAEKEKAWGTVIYWPDGEVLKMARIHNEPEQAVYYAKIEVRRAQKEPRGTPCPTTDATTD